ncbi:hypothetical protein C8J56DRAFT_182070 [Mycena floridula]|nr:hypothetical protein C8J56DRAFT_182070 [Mycena floridula]
MSSQLRLTLLPSPDASNNFVQGYPGIPAGTSPNRPLASIEGSLDLRTAVPIKAKWVCVELQKVETLPAGTKTNTFHDVVDPGPLVLWSKLDTEEWSLLSSLDLPFSLQIPEQVPPTVTLENGASIKYQLVASVCTKAKLSFLRKSSSNIITTQAPVTIDKHELHSVWPIYCRRDAREITESGVTLVVDRNSRCFGPGDRIVLNATVRCDSDTAEILRGFELTLLETTVFREQKPKEPTVISKTKLPVNVTLDPEMQHTVEVSCPLSADHTTTTLTTAKRIEVTYVVAIRALMGSGIHLNIELPVVITNWRRRISEEAIRCVSPEFLLDFLLICDTDASDRCRALVFL